MKVNWRVRRLESPVFRVLGRSLMKVNLFFLSVQQFKVTRISVV